MPWVLLHSLISHAPIGIPSPGTALVADRPLTCLEAFPDALTGVFPKSQISLASLTFPRASVLYSDRCHCPEVKDSQVLQSLLPSCGDIIHGLRLEPGQRVWYKGSYASWKRRIPSRRTHHESHLRPSGLHPCNSRRHSTKQ